MFECKLLEAVFLDLSVLLICFMLGVFIEVAYVALLWLSGVWCYFGSVVDFIVLGVC